MWKVGTKLPSQLLSKEKATDLLKMDKATNWSQIRRKGITNLISSLNEVIIYTNAWTRKKVKWGKTMYRRTFKYHMHMIGMERKFLIPRMSQCMRVLIVLMAEKANAIQLELTIVHARLRRGKTWHPHIKCISLYL